MKTWTEAGRLQRLIELVTNYGRNWTAITRLIGGSPRYDLQDFTDADHGEAPKGAQW